MQISRAVMYHLFASTDTPKRSFWVRLAIFIVMLPCIAWLSGRAAGMSNLLFAHSGVALCAAITLVFTHLVFILSDAAHKVFLNRLRPYHYMPLQRRVLRRMQLMAYMPVTLAAAALIIPSVYAYCGMLPSATRLSIITFFFSLIALTQICMRTAEGWLEKWVQTISYVAAGMGLAVAWAVGQTDNPLLAWLVWAIAGAFVLLTWYAARQSPRPIRTIHVTSIHEWERPGMTGSFALRALRTWRYRGANIILFILFFAAAAYTHQRPSIQFDAVALLGLLLCGTLGQEARAVSRSRYPVELVLYGKLGAWLWGVWALAFANAIVFIEILLTVSFIFFPNSMSLPYTQLIYMGLGMVALGIAAGSLIVSARDDVLAQLASTLLYGGMTYGFLRVCSVMHSYKIIGVSLITLTCILLSYTAERMRWRRAIRGTYASLF